jgi:hypothetical protein
VTVDSGPMVTDFGHAPPRARYTQLRGKALLTVCLLAFPTVSVPSLVASRVGDITQSVRSAVCLEAIRVGIDRHRQLVGLRPIHA